MEQEVLSEGFPSHVLIKRNATSSPSQSTPSVWTQPMTKNKGLYWKWPSQAHVLILGPQVEALFGGDYGIFRNGA